MCVLMRKIEKMKHLDRWRCYFRFTQDLSYVTTDADFRNSQLYIKQNKKQEMERGRIQVLQCKILKENEV